MPLKHWRIQEFTLGGPNQDPQSKVEGEAWIEGAKRPRIEGEARVEGAKRPRIEGEARTESEAREKTEGGVWEGGCEPLPRKFLKNQSWNHAFWCIFEANIWNNDKMQGSRPCSIAHIHEKSILNIWCLKNVLFRWKK